MPVKIFTALLVQDVQNDFLPNGACPVEGAESILDNIAKMAAGFDRVIVTQEFRAADHVSFADKPAFCVEGTVGADLARGLRLPMSRVIAILRGTDKTQDSYSAFLEADRKTQTGLKSYCEDRFVNRLYLCGISRDGSLLRTALDAHHFGIEVLWVRDAVVGMTEAESSMLATFADKGVQSVTTEEVLTRSVK